MHSRYDFSHTLCTNDELKTLAIRVYTEVESTFTEDVFLNDEIAATKEVCSTIEQLSSRSRAGKYTDEIDLTDKKRDKLTSTIRRALKNDIEMVDLDADMADKAQHISKIMSDNPVDIRAGYTKQSSQTNQLLSVAQKPVNSLVIDASSVARYFAALTATQNRFEELVLKQSEENSEVPSGEVKTHVIDLVFRLEGIFSYIERKALIDTQYENTAANVEEIINSIMAPARARATKKESEKSAE